MLTVACVLKSGGDFTAEYVVRLNSAVERHLAIEHRFICLTDQYQLYGVAQTNLIMNWPGWWSKLELFRPALLRPPVLYFDLDTVIMDDIAPLAQMATESEFMMLERFRFPGDFASGVMGWNRDHSYLFRHMAADPDPDAWDQRYITTSLRERGTCIRRAQDAIPTYSYKNHVLKDERCVADAAIVCFHGHPRPHELAEHGDVEWLKENWR